MAYPGYNMSDIYGQVPVRRQRQMGGLLPPGWPNEDLAGPFATSYSPAREFYSDVAGTVGRGLLDPDFWSGAGKEATLGLLGLPADLAVFGAGVAPAMIDNWAEGRPCSSDLATLSDYPLTSDSLARDFGIPFKGTGPENAGRVVGGIFDLTNLPRAARMARGLFEPRSGVGAGGAIPEMIGAQPIARGMRGMVAYQGSPHKFDALDPSKIGTGQGAQTYGHGLYVAENKGVGQWYADELGSFDRVTGGADTAPSIATNLADELGDGLFDVLDSLRASKYTDDDGIHHVMDDGSEIIEIGNQGAWDALSAPLNKYLYEIEVPDADIAKMLDWDKPLSEQSQSVRDALKTAGFEYDPSVQARLDEINDLTESMAKDRLPDNRMRQEAEWHALKREADELGRRLSMSNPTGEQMYKSMATDKFGKVAEILRDDEAAFASEYLNNLGIPGIKYYDQGSRAAGEGTRNMVLFDDLARRAKVLKRNDEIIEQPSVNRGNFRQGGAVDPSGDMGPTGGILGDLHAAGTARFALDPRQMSLDEAREGVVAHAGDYSSPITVKPEDAATTLRRRVQGYDPESGAGAPKTPHGVLRAEGQPDFRIGEPTTDEWINEIETTLGAEGITEARRWYEDFSKLYHKLYPNDPERAMREMIASLAANQSKSPAGAALDANRASESLRNFRHTKKFGMSGDKILALLRGDTTGMGIGLKLSDFADSTKGLNVRNATGYSPEGGAPFVADIHSGRDMGLVDWPMYNFLREKYGQKQLDDMGVTLDTSISTDANKKYFDAIAEELEGAEGGLLAKQFAREYNLGKPAMGDVERMFENVEGKGLLGNRELPAWKKEAINEGAVRPTGTFWGDPQYEHAAELGRRIADDLNERGYMGGNWTPAQVQAAGWVKMGKVTDRAPETADAVVAGNTQTMRFESAFGETSPYAAKYPEIADMTTPEREAFTRETGDVVRDMLREELGIAELPPIFGTGTWFDTANPAVNLPIFSSPEAAKVATDAIGYMLQQDSVMGLRYVNSGPDVAMQMRSTDGNWLNSEQTGAFWDALQVNLKSAPVEVRKKISLILAGQSPIDNGMEIVFTKLKGYSANAIHKAFEEQLMPVMEKTLKELGHDGDFEFDIAHAESYFTGNNWSAKANGEDYFQRMEAARPGTGRAIQNNWQPKIEAIIKKHAGQKAKAKQGATKQVGGVVRKAP